jgi:hypothetical protein
MDINTLEEKLGIANLSDAEKLALVKGIESNVQASKAAVKAQEAGQYASLVVDAIKRIKNDLETRFNELNGIIDVKAKTLQDGKDGLQGAKGEKGDRGFDGVNGKDGYNGKDGIDGVDGKDGVGVQDAYIDFDGSLIIKLTDGTEINVGEVVPMDVAEKIKVIGNGGGTSQSVLDSLTSLQNQINTLTGIDGTLGTMAQQDDTSVDINGGAIDGTTIGGTTPAAGTFTTLTATGQTSLGGTANNESLRVVTPSSAPNAYVKVFGSPFGFGYVTTDGSAAASGLLLSSKGGAQVSIYTNNFSQEQFRATHTASAVNYVQVTGAATGANPAISAQGSDSNINLALSTKGTGAFTFRNQGGSNVQLRVYGTNAAVNNIGITGTAAGVAPLISSEGSDTNIDLTLTPKGTGAVRNVTGGGEQLRVANTASAVNYVQVTGGATGVGPFVSAQGSDANVPLNIASKAAQNINFRTGASSLAQFTVVHNGATIVNQATATGSATGVAPSFGVQGSDTNIDLSLTPKGTGNVRFGTYTASMALTVQGYIEIKDSGGTVRKLAVIA